jgi:hypothetical protein
MWTFHRIWAPLFGLLSGCKETSDAVQCSASYHEVRAVASRLLKLILRHEHLNIEHLVNKASFVKFNTYFFCCCNLYFFDEQVWLGMMDRGEFARRICKFADIEIARIVSKVRHLNEHMNVTQIRMQGDDSLSCSIATESYDFHLSLLWVRSIYSPRSIGKLECAYGMSAASSQWCSGSGCDVTSGKSKLNISSPCLERTSPEFTIQSCRWCSWMSDRASITFGLREVVLGQTFSTPSYRPHRLGAQFNVHMRSIVNCYCS